MVLPVAALFVGGAVFLPNKNIPYSLSKSDNNTHTIDTIVNKPDTAMPIINFNPYPMIIGIDPGHDSLYTGSQVNDAHEEELNLAVSKKVDSLFRKEGYNSFLTRTGKSGINTAHIDVNKSGKVTDRDETDARANYIKNKGAKLAIVIHYNVYSESEIKHNEMYYEYNYVHGMEILVRRSNSASSIDSSMYIADKFGQYIRSYGIPVRVHDSGNRMLRERPANIAFLIELGYLTNKKDLETATSKAGQEFNARLIVDFVKENEEYIFGVKRDMPNYVLNLKTKVSQEDKERRLRLFTNFLKEQLGDAYRPKLAPVNSDLKYR